MSSGRGSPSGSRPANTPVGDKSCRADRINDNPLAMGITPVMPRKANEGRDARAFTFERDAYRDRNIVARLIGWLKARRRAFSRYEKTARNVAGMFLTACIQGYLRDG